MIKVLQKNIIFSVATDVALRQTQKCVSLLG